MNQSMALSATCDGCDLVRAYARIALTSAQTSLSTIFPHLLRWTHFCMPSQQSMLIPLFLYLIQCCHYLLHFLHQLLPLSVPYLTSHQKVLNSHPPPLHCHILYTSSPPSSNLFISPPPPAALLYPPLPP